MSDSAPHQYRLNETVQDAIHDDVKALKGAKVVAEMFYPEMNPETAAGIIRAWSLPSRRERPTPDQLFLLIEKTQREVGVSEVARYMESRLGIRITWLEPQDELQELLQGSREDFARIAARQQRIE